MSLPENFEAANLARSHVDSTMPRGASNKLGDNLIPPFWGQSCVFVSRNLSHRFVEPVENPTEMQSIEWKAKIGALAGCGNCDEQASLAFVFLRDRGNRPLDFMTVGDHAFVVLGRETGSDHTDYATWGPEAVVCDPWHEKVYAANNFPTHMYFGWRVGLGRLVGKVDEVDKEQYQIMLRLRLD